ncbi:unnamed protein product [Rhizoctonia solani]|uniref:F-box domain-containing protein n=1 Tax=Rhizoctonia solani TaxID=456999 RepID=A0A8H3H0K0_9AGAM|nr:unnamed protein product [Rhizoctonia solani]
MLDELTNASNRLRVALDHYVRICSNVQDVCLQGTTPENTTSEYAEQVDRELGLIESYDVKMQLAKTAIKVTRNYAFKTAPINHLPTEILTRIFHMARDALPCSADYVALVCSRWRTIALGSASLWSRIDFHHSMCKEYYSSLDWARDHISRSGEMPLDIYISAAPDGPKEGYYDGPMKDLCRLAAPRMRSLHIGFDDFPIDELRGRGYSAIANLFSHCGPGPLTEISTHSEYFGFFTSEHTALAASWTMCLAVGLSQFEDVLSSVTTLHLVGLYPPWTSRAYYGLVELRLITSPNGDASIPEWQLINILRASPGLRIIQTSIDIASRVDENLDVSVSLPDLEVLQVDSEPFRDTNSCHLELVRFLTSGPRPLRFTMQCSGLQLTESSKAQTKAFLVRSNVTQFYADRVCCPFDLLPSMPRLKALVLSDCTSLPAVQSDIVDHSDQQNSTSVVYPKLHICVVLDCSLSLDEFLSAIRQCQIQSLKIYGSRFQKGIDRQEVDLETLERELSGLCPDVQIRDAPMFVEHRDFFFDYTLLLPLSIVKRSSVHFHRLAEAATTRIPLSLERSDAERSQQDLAV